MARLFNGDAYIVITTKTERLDFSGLNNGRRLALRFNVSQTKESKPNQSSLTIFNLSETSRNKIITEGVNVEIYAGYEDLLTIGSGSIQNVNNVKNRTDWETTISFGDGQKNYQQSKFSKSYTGGNDIKNIITDVAESFGLSIKNEVKKLTGKIDKGLTLDGLSKDVLDELAKQNDIKWSIQDAVLQLVDIGNPILKTAIVISSATGLLGHPIITERGVDIKTQLNPEIRPNKLISVEDSTSKIVSEKLKDQRNKSANGIYICDSVQFVGDNFGGGFETNISATRYG